MPELNFSANIGRSIFAVWQEYQSLGLLGGMGHATDLLHQVVLLTAAFILPNSTLRYFWTFLTLFIGGVGAYFLAYFLLKQDKNMPVPRSLGEGGSVVSYQIPALIASLFYTLNISTAQSYFVIFETFSAHFAALPWIILSVAKYMQKPEKKTFAFMFVVFVLSIPSFYVPTIFVVTCMVIALLCFVKLLTNKNRIEIFKRSLIILLTLLVVNAYWLAPFALFTLQNSRVNVNAKINQMATANIFEQNKEFGNLLDTPLLKGFWFNNVDPDINGNNMFMLAPWRSHFANPLVTLSGYLLFIIMLIPIWNLFRKRERKKTSDYLLFTISLFTFGFTMLATDAFPFSIVFALFQKIPLFSQVFRFPFTKFSLMAGLAYSLMLAIGSQEIYQGIKNQESRIKKRYHYSFFIILYSLIIFISWPIFTGNLFYNKERLAIPNEYFRTFDFFKHQDQATRIANLPQPTFWGWTNYGYGMGGSGFIWYGIKQPILDRAFDVWSATSENYYWEASSALYSRDPIRLQNILDKYQATWLLLDENVIYPASAKSLMYPETEKLISEIPGIRLAAQFGKIKIYRYALKSNPKSFVSSTTTDLQNVDIPFWKTIDPAYSTLGNYINSDCAKTQDCLVYPFGSLFSEKQTDNDFKVTENDKNITVSTNLILKNASQIVIPNYQNLEKNIPVTFYKSIDSKGNILLTASISVPKITIDGKTILEHDLNVPVVTLPREAVYPVVINVNGVSQVVVKDKNQGDLLGDSVLSLAQNNQIVASSKNILNEINLTPESLSTSINQSVVLPISSGPHTITVVLPRVNDPYFALNTKGSNATTSACNNFRNGQNTLSTDNTGAIMVRSANTTECLSFYLGSLFSDQGYAVFVNSDKIAGRPFHFWILNEDEKTSPIDTYLSGAGLESFVLPPAAAGGLGYSFHFDNGSIGHDINQNTLKKLEVHPIPYNFLTNISLGLPKASSTQNNLKIDNISHPNESLYIVNLAENPNPNGILVLAQSYDAGWHAYRIKNNEEGIMKNLAAAFPFIFGSEIKTHVELNSWENAWEINSNTQPLSANTQILIVYMPQYLEYAGFLLLFAATVAVVIKLLKRRNVNK